MAKTREKWTRFELLLLERHYEHLFKRSVSEDRSMSDVIRELVDDDIYRQRLAQAKGE